ncbi:glycoside hydrolase family 2 protein [Pontibacter sp. 13R65]|uniref:glycoside hydrolase family 2 protein n=1 Tax=Pontibacter sp. 13R65 TaxID=3127458 RepID=UPI00301C75F2
MPQQNNKRLLDKIKPKWEIGYHFSEEAAPEKWIPATVPGAVQLDVMQAENYQQPYWYADNVKQFDWMEDYYFTYRTSFPRPDLHPGQRLCFHSKGIEYDFKISLNGTQLLEQEGMFTYVDLDLTDQLQDINELQVQIKPIPKVAGAPAYTPGTDTYRQHARESAKPAVSYGWDWHPRLVTRGIWDETYLEVRSSTYLTASTVTYQLNEELSQAQVQLNLEGKALAGKHYKWSLTTESGQIAIAQEGILSSNTESISTQLQEPALWWPSGYGSPTLYTSEVTILNAEQEELDSSHSKVGFRRVKLLMNEGEWDKPLVFPASRNRAPASLEINGRRIFAKGTNWVHPEIFIGLITNETYEKQIQLAKEANFNILRIWGGGITNKESFFDLCDEQGMLVWQEFPLACNNYTDKASYLAVLEQEATSIINRVKAHACLAIWSGGNELFNAWGGMTDQSLALRLLNSLCYRLDPYTPFVPTSPLNGMGHGSYLFYDKTIGTGEEVFQWMQRADNTAYTEFGVPGVANLEVLKQYIPPHELFPPKRETAWETHHAFGAWRKDSWLELPFLEEYFGEITSLEDLVRFSQLTQSEGLKFIYEEARRQKPYCSMALNWCFQEPWPVAANNSLVNWPNILKPAYYEVAAACRPVLASLRVPKFLWHEGEDFICEPFLLNDTYDPIAPAQITVTLLYDGGKSLKVTTWTCPGAPEFQNSQGSKAQLPLPDMHGSFFTVSVEVESNPAYNSRYTFMYRGKNETGVKPGAAF